jgi:hypothetical protein
VIVLDVVVKKEYGLGTMGCSCGAGRGSCTTASFGVVMRCALAANYYCPARTTLNSKGVQAPLSAGTDRSPF